MATSRVFPSPQQKRRPFACSPRCQPHTSKSATVLSIILMFNGYMGVSKNRGTPKSSHFNRVFHYKPSILGYHYFWKHPYGVFTYASTSYHGNPQPSFLVVMSYDPYFEGLKPSFFHGFLGSKGRLFNGDPYYNPHRTG